MTQHIENYWYIGKDGKPITAKGLEDQRDEARTEVERLRGLIARYSLHVVNNEGTDFLHDSHYTGAITKEEMSEICQYQEALK